MQSGMTDLEADLIIEQCRAQRLTERVQELRAAYGRGLLLGLCTSLRLDSALEDLKNIELLCDELLKICESPHFDPAEARRRGLAIKHILTARAPRSGEVHHGKD